jgi:hypothetical protein
LSAVVEGAEKILHISAAMRQEQSLGDNEVTNCTRLREAAKRFDNPLAGMSCRK